MGPVRSFCTAQILARCRIKSCPLEQRLAGSRAESRLIGPENKTATED
jgi:hypothetical protein